MYKYEMRHEPLREHSINNINRFLWRKRSIEYFLPPFKTVRLESICSVLANCGAIGGELECLPACPLWCRVRDRS